MITATAQTKLAAAEPPIAGLMDKRFVWVPSYATDVRATLNRVRAEMAAGGHLVSTAKKGAAS